MPDEVSRSGDVLEFHLGPEICDRLAGIATVRLRVREPDIGVVGTTVVAWPAMLTSGAARCLGHLRRHGPAASPPAGGAAARASEPCRRRWKSRPEPPPPPAPRIARCARSAGRRAHALRRDRLDDRGGLAAACRGRRLLLLDQPPQPAGACRRGRAANADATAQPAALGAAEEVGARDGRGISRDQAHARCDAGEGARLGQGRRHPRLLPRASPGCRNRATRQPNSNLRPSTTRRRRPRRASRTTARSAADWYERAALTGLPEAQAQARPPARQGRRRPHRRRGQGQDLAAAGGGAERRRRKEGAGRSAQMRAAGFLLATALHRGLGTGPDSPCGQDRQRPAAEHT